MLISVCGPPGSGKSTLISQLVDHYDDINVIERKTARSILTEWNMTLQDVYSSTELMMKFQDEIIRRKILDELEASISDNIWITERTYIDLLAFSVANLGRIDACSDWLDDYAKVCLHQQCSYDLTIKLPTGKFAISVDGVRPTNSHYGVMVDLFMDKYLELSTANVYRTLHSGLDDRLTECVTQINLIRG
jgi:hypothetical protein